MASWSVAEMKKWPFCMSFLGQVTEMFAQINFSFNSLSPIDVVGMLCKLYTQEFGFAAEVTT